MISAACIIADVARGVVKSVCPQFDPDMGHVVRIGDGVRGITSDIEVIAMQNINAAYDRLLTSDAKSRFVIDMAALKQ